MPWTKWTEEQKFHKEFHVDLAHFHKTFLFLLLLIEENNTSQESREEEKEEGGGAISTLWQTGAYTPLYTQKQQMMHPYTHTYTQTHSRDAAWERFRKQNLKFYKNKTV